MSSALLIAIGTFAGVVLVVYLVYSLLAPKKTPVQMRLDEIASRRNVQLSGISLDTSVQKDTRFEQSVSAIGSALPLSTQTLSKARRMLIQAGYRKASAPLIFYGFKVAAATAAFALLFMYTMSVKHDMRLALILGVLGIVAGLLIPNVWLTEKLKKRQTDIFHTLPDVLDLMTVCVEAGLGLDASIIKITEERQFSKRVLSQEFAIVSQEIRAGKPRIDALRDLGERTGVEDVKALVALLIQTERLGASLSRSLRVHSDSLRTKRRQLAEEAAAKTTIKLVFPLAFFIFPTLLIVLLGPAVIRIFDVLFTHLSK
jgi:tight adherence protein C